MSILQCEMEGTASIDVKPLTREETLARENASLRRQLAIRNVELSEKQEELRRTVNSLKTALAFKNQKIKNLEGSLTGEESDRKIVVKREVEDKEGGTSTKRKRTEDGVMEVCSSCGSGKDNLDGSSVDVLEKKVNVRFTDISKMDESSEYSSPTVRMAGVEWGVVVSRSKIEEQDYLAVHLELRSERVPDGWSCAVMDKVLLHSHLANKPAHSGLPSSVTVYDGASKSWGYEDFISFTDLFNKKNGYVVNDSIMISIEIKTFPTVTKSDCAVMVPKVVSKDVHPVITPHPLFASWNRDKTPPQRGREMSIGSRPNAPTQSLRPVGGIGGVDLGKRGRGRPRGRGVQFRSSL